MDESVQALDGFDSEVWPESRLAKLAGLADRADFDTWVGQLRRAETSIREIPETARGVAGWPGTQEVPGLAAARQPAVLTRCTAVMCAGSAPTGTASTREAG